LQLKLKPSFFHRSVIIGFSLFFGPPTPRHSQALHSLGPRSAGASLAAAAGAAAGAPAWRFEAAKWGGVHGPLSYLVGG